VIIEDLGPLGVGGRHLYEVEVPMDPFESTISTLREDEIEPAGEPTEAERRLARKEIINYLRNGGLISILFTDLSGGRNQPRVWLCRDSLGNLTHTFAEERGIVGGRTVPFSAIYGDRVFSPKKDEVLSFLQSFNLNRDEAEYVLASVGTAP
jgi:hypothetical protein